MSEEGKPQSRFPLLEAVLAAKGKSLQGMYSYDDVRTLFGCSVRALQTRIADNELTIRDLPGKNKFLDEDLENFLRESAGRKKAKRRRGQ